MVTRYSELRPSLGTAFVVEVTEVLERIAETPGQFPAWTDDPHFRKAVFPVTFPYVLFFHELDLDTVEIVAVAHSAREPGYWLGRR